MPTSPQYLPDLRELGLSTVVAFLGKDLGKVLDPICKDQGEAEAS